METVATHASGTIAWLKPGAVDRESLDVFAMTPPDVKLSAFTSTLATHMTEGEFDAEAFNRLQRVQILEQVRGLADYSHPAFTAVTSDLIQATMGVPWNEALRDDISQITGTPSASAMTAVTDALTFLGARRVSVATPYGAKKNGFTQPYFVPVPNEAPRARAGVLRAQGVPGGVPAPLPCVGVRD